jgi:signal transduction histidine kinase
VMGTAMVLQGLLKNPSEQISVNRAVLTRLQEGCDRQLMMLNALLEAYACELEPLQLQQEPINLDTLVQSVLSDLEPTLAKNQIRVENAIRADLPLVYADINQLWRVYCNLITNAVKHNPHGISIRLDAEILTSPPRKHGAQTVNPHMGMVRCTVSDTGVGLEPAQAQQIFELYVRGKRARYMPGLGLGLYLCRQIVLAHGGEIGVNSRIGEGASFWFTLPLAR